MYVVFHSGATSQETEVPVKWAELEQPGRAPLGITQRHHITLQSPGLEVLDGPLVFTPDGKTYRFEGSADTEKLLGR